MNFDVRATLKRRIAAENDATRRDTLMLIDAVCDHTESVMRTGTDEILARLDALRNDEDAMRKLVLNGLASSHHEEHERCHQDHVDLRKHLEASEANQALIVEARPLMDFVAAEMKAREAAATTRKSLLMKLLEGAANQIGTILVTAVASVFAAVHFIKG
jgi:hypothetical protein